MNILIIGNGFDLAHGLPTKYTDFLDFVKVIKRIYFADYDDIYAEEAWQKLNMRENTNKESLKEFFINIYNTREVEEFKPPQDVLSYIVKTNIFCDEFHKNIVNNIWVDYFLHCGMHQRDNWIDFESEISRIIQMIDNALKSDGQNENTIIRKFSEVYFSERFLDDYDEMEQEREEKALREIKKIEKREGEKWNISKKIEYLNDYNKKHPIQRQKEIITYKGLISRLKQDLNSIIRALEIYLTVYVAELDITNICKDIKNLNIDHVLSFNYTDTYKRLYGTDRIDYDYIHGEANINNTIDSNNMVLGIDEYLSKKRRNKDVRFIAFKKYYQRIHKQIGCKYKEWVDKIIEEEKKKSWIINGKDYSKDYMHNIYIFGHSLDVTDKDILRDLILHENVYTTIFYPDKEELGKKIANLVKVIGQDELIRRTGGSTKTIEFKLQQDMIERNPTANQPL